MDTLFLDRPRATYLVNTARVLRNADQSDDQMGAMVYDSAADQWVRPPSGDYITWITGNFVESDRPNNNHQMWSRRDLETARHTIVHAPMNIAHKSGPVGMFVDTRIAPRPRTTGESADSADVEIVDTSASSPICIQVLGGLWSHLFPFQAAQVERASEEGTLFWSMECQGTHVRCEGPAGCGQTFGYFDWAMHCPHLMGRRSVRHIINPTFRGGAILVPPVKPGWKGAHANLLPEEVMVEAAAVAEATEDSYDSLLAEGLDLSPAAWEHLMGMVVSL